jgi:hypothetical protein
VVDVALALAVGFAVALEVAVDFAVALAVGFFVTCGFAVALEVALALTLAVAFGDGFFEAAKAVGLDIARAAMRRSAVSRDPT